jgi:hypothetical protein
MRTNGWTADDDHSFLIENLQFVTIPGYTFQYSRSNISINNATAFNSNPATSWNVQKYNNGPNEIWPAYPHTPAEKALLEELGEEAFVAQYRPSAPAPRATDFKAEVVSVVPTKNGNNLDLVVTFSEALRKGELGFGLNVADKWTTSWNDEGTVLTISIANDDLNGVSAGNLILFSLRDVAGNLIGGPVENSFTVEYEPSVSISGSVGAMQGEDVSYLVSVAHMQKLATATLWFEVEDAFLAGKAYEALNGFDMIDNVSWTQDGDKWIGRVTLGNFEGGVDVARAQDIFKMTYQVKEALGETEVKLTKAQFSGYDENNEAVFIEAPIANDSVTLDVEEFFAVWDVNRDKVVDQLDLTTAQLAYATSEGEENWNANADVNDDGKVDVEDFIQILNNIEW